MTTIDMLPDEILALIEETTGSLIYWKQRNALQVAIAQLLDPYKIEIEELKNDLLECREANASQREKIERQRSEIAEINTSWSKSLALLEKMKGTK